MGRVKSNPVIKYFKYNDETDLSECEVPGCNKNLKGKHSANLERHLQSRHPDEYQNVQLLKMDPKRKECSINRKSLSCAPKKPKLENCETNDKKAITQRLIEACIELVTINGRPLNLLNDSGFRKIIDPIIFGLDENIYLNKESIQHMLMEKAEQLRESIKNDCGGKLLSLKIDCVKKMKITLIIVYLQYIKNGKMVLKTLCTEEVKMKNANQSLKCLLFKTLNKYSIDIRQIYSVTIDDCTDMIKVPEAQNIKLDNTCTESITKREGDDLQIDVSLSVLCDNNKSLESSLNYFDSDDLTVKAEISLDISDNENQEDMYINQSTESSLSDLEPKLFVVRCPEHILERAVGDVLKMESEFINKTQSIYNILTQQTWMDCNTKWTSTYDMLQRILDMRDLYSDIPDWNADLKLEESDWELIRNIVDSLQPAKVASIELQNDQLVMGDFYGIWWKCYNATVKLDIPLAQSLCKAMQHKEKVLFENNISRAALYLDPRYQCVLSAKSKEAAKISLFNAWNKFKKMSNDVSQSSMLPQSDREAYNQDESSEDLENMLKSRKVRSEKCNHELDILYILNSFDYVEHVHHKSNIFEYWDIDNRKRGLHSLAHIALAIPATRVSIDKSYSGIEFILANSDMELREDLLESVLIIKGYDE